MIIKDIFRVFIKLTALYYAFFGFIFFLETVVNSQLNDMFSLSSIWILIFPIVYILLFYILFIKTEFIISLLNLNKNFENREINFGNLNSKEIIKISLLVVGFILFVENIPEFLSHCFYSFKYSTESKLFNDNSYNKEQYLRWAVTGINILIGYLIISNYKRIGNWIDKKQQ